MKNTKYFFYLMVSFLFLSSSKCNKDDDDAMITRCMDMDAINYNEIGECMYEGCTNILAENYNPMANVDNTDTCKVITDLFEFTGNLENPSGVPAFVLDDNGNWLDQDDVIPSIENNRLKIQVENVNLKKDGKNYELTEIAVEELRPSGWQSDPSSVATFFETTIVNLVIIVQRAPAGLDEIELFGWIQQYAKEILDQCIQDEGLSYNIAIVHYGDGGADVIREDNPFFELSTSTITSMKDSIEGINYELQGAKPLAEAVVTAVDLLVDFQVNADYETIFIVGDGYSDSGISQIPDAVEYLQNNQITDVFCFGALVQYDNLNSFQGDRGNFEALADVGEGHFEVINLANLIGDIVYDKHYYIQVPNKYTIEYDRTSYVLPDPIDVKWILTGESKP